MCKASGNAPESLNVLYALYVLLPKAQNNVRQTGSEITPQAILQRLYCGPAATVAPLYKSQFNSGTFSTVKMHELSRPLNFVHGHEACALTYSAQERVHTISH